MTITAILPAFNEEASIGSTVLKIKKYVDHVIVVDNGSADNTAEIAWLAGADAIRFPKNMGKGEAIKTGFYAACQNGTKIIVTIDALNKNCIDIIPETIGYIKNDDYDLVVGSRNSNISCDKSFLSQAYNNVELLAFSIEFLNKPSLSSIDITRLNGSPIREILCQAEKNNLKIKCLNFGKECNLNQFNGYNISVVVPAYNEERFIEETINGIPEYIKKIYVIDDCSTDKTPEIINSLANSRIISVRHEKNRGVGAAIVTGYKLALEDNMDIVAVMAGDNQMDPEQLPRLLIPVIEGRADYTKGNRLISKDFRRGMSKWRTVGNAMLTMITKIGSGYWQIMDPQNGYTAISGQTLKIMDLDSIYPYYGYCNDILMKLNTLGMRVEDVVMPARYGQEKSKIKYSRFIAKVAPMIFRGFLWRLKTKYIILDFHPLVFFYFASMLLLPFGIVFNLWILYQKIYHNPVSPNYPLLAVFITLMGLQLLLFAMLFDMQAGKKRRMEEVL
jgi:glycosyltransferase involved in cell wall biosynthesis